MQKIDPAKAGFDARRLGNLGEIIQRDIDNVMYDGCVVIVARKSGVVFHEAFGFAERDTKRKMEKGSLFHTMSTGKQFTAAMALNRVELGDLRLTTMVRELVPEFATRGKNAVNLFHLLTHTAGLVTDMIPGITLETWGNLEANIKALCGTAAINLPGERVTYSAYAGAAMTAEMVRRVDPKKRAWRDIVRQEMFEPLGMMETAAGLPNSRRDRICPIMPRGEKVRDDVKMVNQMINEEFEIPAGGYTTTAEDMHRFVTMLLNKGELDGFRFLSPATLELVAQNHTGDDDNIWYGRDVVEGRWPPQPSNYGLGFFTRGEGVHPMPFGALASPRTFGGLGHGSTMFWIDPVRDLSMVFLSTGLIDEWDNFQRCQRYSDVVHASLLSW